MAHAATDVITGVRMQMIDFACGSTKRVHDGRGMATRAGAAYL